MNKKKKLKIAFICQPFLEISFPQPSDSIGIITYQVISHISHLSRNFDITVYSPIEKRIWGKTETEQGVRYQYITTRFEEIIVNKLLRKISKFFNNKTPIFASKIFYFLYALQISIDLRLKQYEIVHIHNFSQFIFIIRALNPKIKIVLHMHCQWLTQLDRDMIEQRLRHADLVIGCSEFITEKIRHQFPEFASKCQTVYNGVDSSFFNRKNHNKHAEKNGVKQLLFVGRVSPEKGVHILLEAFEKVVKRFPKVHLNIVGGIGSCPKEFIIALSDDDPKVGDLISFYVADPVTGKELSYFEQLQKRLSPELAKYVTFCGPIPHEKLNTYYRDADIFINSSFSEAFPVPIPEAMAGSLPVVGSRVGGIPEAILNEKTGFVVESGNSNELAEAILRF